MLLAFVSDAPQVRQFVQALPAQTHAAQGPVVSKFPVSPESTVFLQRPANNFSPGISFVGCVDRSYPSGMYFLCLFLTKILLLGVCFLGLVGCESQPTHPAMSHQTSIRAIVGGQPDLRHPAVGALVRDQIVFCSGTLIAPRVVLTAAHCIDSAFSYHIGNNRLQFRIDTEDQQASHGYQTHFFDIEPALLSRHPQWQSYQVQQGYDVGVVILQTPVPHTLSPPIPFNDSSLAAQDWQNKEALFLGYGLILSVPYAISPNRKYGALLNIQEVRTDRITIQSAGKSVCHGDSGGPALGQINGEWRVLAVNSYALTDFAQDSNPPRTRCEGGAVGVRTDVYKTYLQSWVDRFQFESLNCQSDKDCGSCGVCVSTASGSSCRAKQTTQQNKTCLPCRQDSDCNGGFCAMLPEGRRCLGLCDNNLCCPDKTSCINKTVGSQTRSLCTPWKNTCPSLSCQSSGDCSDLENCVQGVCTRKTLSPLPKQCFPCQQDTDCGDSQRVCVSVDGHLRCLPLCTKGACPPGMQCAPDSPGYRSVCKPQSSCVMPCQTQQDCPPSLVCEKNTCKTTTLASVGDSCRDQLCASGLDCVDTHQGKICLQPCHVTPGQAGGACLNERTCTTGHACLIVRGLKYKFCVAECQSNQDCPSGGTCSRGFCMCQKDQECTKGAICENRFGSDTGFCVKQDTIRSCNPGETCTFFTQGSYCIREPRMGSQMMGQPCDSFSPCQDGLTCVEFGRQAGVCMEMCAANRFCLLGGTCEQGYCFCSPSSPCPTGRNCQLFLDIPARVGICLPDPDAETPCVDDRECRSGTLCLKGLCRVSTDPENLVENPDIAEVSMESILLDASTEPELSSESPRKHDTQDASIQKDAFVTQDAPDDREYQPPAARACGCGSSLVYPGWGFFWLLAGLGVLLFLQQNRRQT